MHVHSLTDSVGYELVAVQWKSVYSSQDFDWNIGDHTTGYWRPLYRHICDFELWYQHDKLKHKGQRVVHRFTVVIILLNLQLFSKHPLGALMSHTSPRSGHVTKFNRGAHVPSRDLFVVFDLFKAWDDNTACYRIRLQWTLLCIV